MKNINANKSSKVLEEELKYRIAEKYFSNLDCADRIKRIDFAVRPGNSKDYFLWAEAKQNPTEPWKMIAQLILTIHADTNDIMPPKYIGCFDSEKICFIDYHEVMPIFNVNDFNWTQTPSYVDDKTVETVRKTIGESNLIKFFYKIDDDSIKDFVKTHFNGEAAATLSTLVDRNNFIFVYQKWRQFVMPYIDTNWDFIKKSYSIYDRDFFLAELNVDDNGTIDISDDKPANSDFYITFDATLSKPYMLKKNIMGLDTLVPFGFKKGWLEAYADFWKRYKRAPAIDSWNYIKDRLDLLVPQDVREIKGAFFTPQIWVEKSQQYIADALGEDWQTKYYIWDCCCGTGNLLNGLSNKYQIFASTLDQQDVDVIKDNISNGRTNLLENHVFQFDFLNDGFDKLPSDLRDIINDTEKRKRLIIYINPPYKAPGNKTKNFNGEETGNCGVSETITYKKCRNILGSSSNELFVQFFYRIYSEIQGCLLGEFSTLKILQAPSYAKMRQFFRAKLVKSFIVPADTFDNVKGQYPIGFFLWDIKNIELFSQHTTDVYDRIGKFVGHKTLYSVSSDEILSNWISKYASNEANYIGLMSDYTRSDFQHSENLNVKNDETHLSGTTRITYNNLIPMCVSLQVRQCIPATWLNDRDQFLYPNSNWETDKEFQSDCLTLTLFHGKNRISANNGVNHWIPFTEEDVCAKSLFKSHFMTDFINGRIKPKSNLFDEETTNEPIIFSEEAKAVFNAGRHLWKYYHSQSDAVADASYYDIREYFQGRNDNGKMNTKSSDVEYTRLLKELKDAMKVLNDKIVSKVYEYGFLRQ